jgi:glycosyltransferase involved in cell wall biosynthesis
MTLSEGAVATSGLRTAGNLHILTLTPFYPSEADDANGCFVSEPLEWLERLGIRGTVIAVQPFYRGKLRSGDCSIRGEWLRYFSLPGGFGLPAAGAFVFARIVGQLRDLHRTQPIDLIHAHGPLPCGHAAMLLSHELNIPYVVSVHGLDAFSTVQVGGRAGEWCRRISRRVYGSSSRVICVSERVREAVQEGMDRNCHASVVYNGVDIERFFPASTPDAPLRVLSVGNLIPIKGHEHLVRAVGSLVHDFPALELDIIGDGSERESLQGLVANLHLANKIYFCGRQSRAQVAKAMQRCTVFALPSRYEALGCVYLEAMACGKPTIACRGQGIDEIIEDGKNGCLVNQNAECEKELTDVLGALLREPRRCIDMGRIARETISERLTLKHQAANLLQIYRECSR